MAEQRRAFWDLQPLPPAKPAQPVAWIRQHPDGTLTGELLLDSQIEDVRKRSGAWVPLGRIDGVDSVDAAEQAEGIIAKLDYLTTHIADHWQRDWKGDKAMRAQNAVELDELKRELKCDIKRACGVKEGS